MKIQWEIELQTGERGASYPDHEMDFKVFEDKIYYCYLTRTRDSRQLVVCVFNDMCEFKTKSYSFAEKENVKLPKANWQYQIHGSELLLYAGTWFNISNEQISIQESFQMEMPKYVFPSIREYVFCDKIVSFPKERTVICTNQKTKEIHWKHALKGYPYTSVEYKDGCVIFGTAGWGGALYCIDLETGAIKRDTSTKGTAHYCWYGNHIAMKDGHGHLQVVDPFSDNQIGLLKLKNRLVDYSPMIVQKDYLYTITFSNATKIGVATTPYLTCFLLNS
jgi:hypothetical protein